MKNILRWLFITAIGMTSFIISCSQVNSNKYEVFNNPNWEFSIEYPKAWQQKIDQRNPNVEVSFVGNIGRDTANITAVYLSASYDEMFKIFNSPMDVAKLENKDMVSNNIKYSTFTQVVNNVFTRIYICELSDNAIVMVSSDIDNNASQNNKDTLVSYLLHIVGSLTRRNE